ncbi:tubulin polymerization-promoting protein family member 2 isoform X2 [Phascolarctos cinereus]
MESEAEKTFHLFAAFGDSSSSGGSINNKNFTKLCKDCGIIDGKMVNNTDVDIVFSKVKERNARTINWNQFQMALKELGQKKFKEKKSDEKAVAVGGVDRLTDTSKYTGSHKERFDESGKGKRKAGRDDTKENTGYVSGYKDAGTYDQKKK